MQKFDERNFESLERQTEIAFSELKHAIETRNPSDAGWTTRLYSAVDDALASTTNTLSGTTFMKWNRGTRRANLFDRYILQYAIGMQAAGHLVSRISPELKPHLILTENEYDEQLAIIKKII